MWPTTFLCAFPRLSCAVSSYCTANQFNQNTGDSNEKLERGIRLKEALQVVSAVNTQK